MKNKYTYCLITLLATAIGFCQCATAQVFTTSLSQSSHSDSPTVKVYEFDATHNKPEFPGGERGLFNYINSERRYPHSAFEHNIEGRVLLSFIICPDGSVSNISVIRSVEQTLDMEAVRIISGMPKWQPGTVDNAPVYVRCVMPVVFRL